MAYGIEAHPVGPGPAAPASLFIDSGLTFPQSIAHVDADVPRLGNNQKSHDFPFSGWDGTGTMVAIPTRPVCWSFQGSTDLIPTCYGITSVDFPNTSTFRSHYNFDFTAFHREGWNLYKIWPQGNQSYGVTFSNTANFFALNDAATVCQCIWAYSGAVGSGFQIPAIAGYDMNQSVVFGNWNDPNMVVTYNHFNREIIVTNNHSNNRGNNHNGSVNMNIVVFCTGPSGVAEHNGGFNIYNSNHTACVFSTLNSPFALSGFISTAGGNTGIAKPMVCLTYGVGAIAEQGGGWQWQHIRGQTMSGSSVGTGWGPIITSWTDRYDAKQNFTLNLSLPLLDATKYFANPI